MATLGMISSDPRKPFIVGISVLAVLMFGGMVWAVVSASTETSSVGRYDANVSFIDEGDPFWGPEDAPIVIRMFEDFECPACVVAKQGIDHVKQKYGDSVRIIWNDFPLDSIHPRARISSNAARCAEEQGRFWEYHDVLYDAHTIWTRSGKPSELFIQYATQLGLNEAAFTVCLDERRYRDKIQNDLKEAKANRVDATPTFFINSTRVTGALMPEDWDRALKPFLDDVTGTQKDDGIGEGSADVTNSDTSP